MTDRESVRMTGGPSAVVGLGDRESIRMTGDPSAVVRLGDRQRVSQDDRWPFSSGGIG